MAIVKSPLAPRFANLRSNAWGGIVLALVSLAYVFAESRYPALNYDDTYLLAGRFPGVGSKVSLRGLYDLLFDLHSGTNEFRTYALARGVHFVLYEFFATDLLAYYLAMAFMACAFALLIARAVRLATGSGATAVTACFVCLVAPFSLYQTFHHASYILMPMVFFAGYLALVARGIDDRTRRIGGLILCILTVLSGEVVTMVLVAAIAMLAAFGLLRRRWPVTPFLWELATMAAVFGLLYAHYRWFLFEPALAPRFENPATTTFEQFSIAFGGFQDTIAGFATSFRFADILAVGVVLDTPVAAALIAAGFVTSCFIATRAEPPARPVRSALLLTFVGLLYAASSLLYILIAARANVANFPPRYLHFSGALALVFCTLAASTFPSFWRKTALVGLVAMGVVAGVLTFGIKVPTLEAAHADLKARILAAGGSGRVAFDTPPATGGYLNPYLLEPATSPYTGYWILENFCPLTMNVRCTRGEGAAGDVVVTPLHYREGYLTDSRIELKR